MLLTRFWSGRQGGTKKCVQYTKVIDLIIEYLPKALERRSIDALEKLSTASTFAAMAFRNASLGLDHALAHSLDCKLDLAHGLIHPVLLPGVMRFSPTRINRN